MITRSPLQLAVLSAFAMLFSEDCNSNHRLGITKVGTGNGNIAAVASGTPIALTCEDKTCFNNSVGDGKTVTLTATATAGSFGGWVGACQTITAAGECVVKMDGRRQVWAAFSSPAPAAGTAQLSLKVTGNGTAIDIANAATVCNASTNCRFNIPRGAPLILRAVPATGSDGQPIEFVKWSLSPVTTTATCIPADNFPDCVIVVTDPVTATASFKRFLITIQQSGLGTVSMADPARLNCGSECTENVNQDESITLTPTANAGAAFVGWSGGPAECQGAGPCTFRVYSDHTITPRFTDMFTLRITHSTTSGSAGGHINAEAAAVPLPVMVVSECQAATCDATVQSGTLITVTAHPKPGAGATFTGACAGGPVSPVVIGNKCTFLMQPGMVTAGVRFN